MSRRTRQSRDVQDVAGRIEPRFAARPEEEARALSALQASPTPMTPMHPPQENAAPAPPSPNPYALPEHVIPSWMTRQPAPLATPQAAPAEAGRPETTSETLPPVTESPAAEARVRESYWSKIHVPDEERARAAKAGLDRYVKEAAVHEMPRKARVAPPRPTNGTGDGKPRIWLTVIALLMLFGAGAYGLSQLADAPHGGQNAEWRPSETTEPPAPAAPPNPASTPAPTPSFIEVAP